MFKWVGKYLKNNKGQGMTEYIIIVAIIAVAAIAIVGFYGDAIKARFSYVVATITGQSTGVATSQMTSAAGKATAEAAKNSRTQANFQ